MSKRLTGLMLLVLASPSFAGTPGNIATLCKLQWPGDKGLQSFCIKEKRNYQEWLDFSRKRVYADLDKRTLIDECISSHAPDYREAFDCVFATRLFGIALF